MRQLDGQESTAGLIAAVAAARLKLDGYNELPAPDKRGFVRILSEMVHEPMFALLLGDRLEALFLLVFACLSVTITIVQESRREHVSEALRNLASPRALVIRDAKQIHIAGRDVVRDDILIVNEGARVAVQLNPSTVTILNGQPMSLF
jgi:P-type Ca2+ transporter type 2C